MYLCRLDFTEFVIKICYMDGNTALDAFGTIEIALELVNVRPLL
jgi:hypothetical protein